MLRIEHQGLVTEMKWEELKLLLEDSSLPWFMDDANIVVIGWGQDVQLKFNMIHQGVIV